MGLCSAGRARLAESGEWKWRSSYDDLRACEWWRTRRHILADSLDRVTLLILCHNCFKFLSGKIKLQISVSVSVYVCVTGWPLTREYAVLQSRQCDPAVTLLANVCYCLAQHSTFLHTEQQRLDSTQTQKRPHCSASPKRIVFRLRIIFNARHSSNGLCRRYGWVHMHANPEEHSHTQVLHCRFPLSPFLQLPPAVQRQAG